MQSRVLHTFVKHGLIDWNDFIKMRTWAHSDSVPADGSVCIEGAGRTGSK